MPSSYDSYEKDELIHDYKIAFLSREASLLGRKEVLGGKAKFGIFGDGKELAQIAMAKVFRPGDWRSGYYRDQTFMLASEALTISEFFAQLYADTDLKREPHSGGRQMNCHFGSRFLDEEGQWVDQSQTKNISSDISSTGGQMARLLGLAYASKLYGQVPELKKNAELTKKFTRGGKELAFGTIGNASTSEGLFWEVMNACGVLELPIMMSVWDDDYGISVPNKFQTTKQSISEAMKGFEDKEDGRGGFLFFTAKGSDYLELRKTYEEAEEKCRRLSKPCLIHITHMTQPQGHSTSGSHERYKSKERLQYEIDTDCISQFRKELLQEKIIQENTLLQLEESLKKEVFETRTQSFEAIQKDRQLELKNVFSKLSDLPKEAKTLLEEKKAHLENQSSLSRESLHKALRRTSYELLEKGLSIPDPLAQESSHFGERNREIYQSCLFKEKENKIGKPIPPEFSKDSTKLDGRLVIRKYFDQVLERDPRVFIVGEDVGKLGGVNLEFENLQEKHGELRVTDTGIREASILGQGLGAAMRGLRPIVDIQYLDYLIYCLQGMTDDLATLHYRTRGGQASPCIIRTKGHRLEGIWHTGSPMSMLLGSLRGVHLCVPRNSVQACGFYETLLHQDDPALVIEVLNGYRLKEKCPDNLGSFRLELGVPEVLETGKDLTIVTYGACVNIAKAACEQLKKLNISAELIDVQTLLPFDKYHMIGESLSKTNAVIFMDEDVPGGGSAYMMQEVLEKQGAYNFLDAKPRTLSASSNRSAYASDGDYYCKPSAEDLIDLCLEISSEKNPQLFQLNS